MRIHDAVLNAYFIGLCLLFVTGGSATPDSAPGGRLLAEASQLGPWVAGFLAILAARYLRDRERPLGDIPFVRWLDAMGRRLSSGAPAIYALTAVWAALLVAVAIRRHLAFDDNGDLAIFDQAFWNTTQGRLLRSTVLPQTSEEHIIFSDHFDPLQLVLLPVYALIPSPLVLLAAQGIMLALGAIPLYWLARDRLPGQRMLVAIFPLLYLLYLPLRAANRYDYHPNALAPPLLLFALYFMDKRRWAPMTLFLVMAGLLKENLPIAGVMVGLYLFAVKRRPGLGLALIALFALWFHAGFSWIVPAFAGSSRYAHFLRLPAGASSAPSLLIAPLLHPVAFVTALCASPARKLTYLLYVFGPVAFLPLLAPALLLLGIPFLLQNLVSDVPHQTGLSTHHSAELIPFMFHAAIAGAARLLHWSSGRVKASALALVLLAASLVLHGAPETFYLRLYGRTEHHERLAAVLRTIPADVSLSAWTEIAPHVAHRRALYRFPSLGPAGGAEAEMIVLDQTLVPRDGRAEFAAEVAALPARGYDKQLDEDGILVFQKSSARTGR